MPESSTLRAAPSLPTAPPGSRCPWNRANRASHETLALRRRHRRVAVGILWVLGTGAFLGLYALSWAVVLDLS